MRTTIGYSSPEGSCGWCEIDTELFFPCRKADLTTLKKKIVDLQWCEVTKKEFMEDLLRGIEQVRGRVLVDQRYFLEQVRDGQPARSAQEKRLAHFRRMLKDLDMNQEVIESWLQELN